ncbi:hypothetical protein ACLB1M_10960 [Escherichia coli]
MSALPVDDVWGIGRRISKKLDAMGIKNRSRFGGYRYPVYP